MGITPIDLFNDILTTENDLNIFLQQSKLQPFNGIPGMIIQGNFFGFQILF